MTLGSSDDLAALRRAGAVAAEAVSVVRELVRGGITTAELDDAAREVFAKYGAQSAPTALYGFPGTLCISVNDEAVHGIPGPRRLQAGDLVKLDATPLLDGFIADTAISVVVGDEPARAADALKLCAERALQKAMSMVTAGRAARDVGRAVARETHGRGFRVLREVGGHGVGRAIHEEPHIPNWDDPSSQAVLHEGLVVAIEPIIAASTERLITSRDGWTLRTSDGSLAAHAEHTFVVTTGTPIVLTAA